MEEKREWNRVDFWRGRKPRTGSEFTESLKLVEMNISQFLRNMALTAPSVGNSSAKNTLIENRNIARTADADWIGANYEHKAMCEVQILENRIRRMRYKKIIQVLPSSSRYRKLPRKKRRWMLFEKVKEMSLEDYLEDSGQLCWKCKKACGLCSWSHHFEIGRAHVWTPVTP